ncbi:MAG TPA: antitoxin family protein [Pirellulaceae bacterium]|nr:antitoxin family protein [Pirellulaceae bacterium]
MTTSISAIFDHGVFRPEAPVELPEGTRVTLTIDVASEERRKRQEAVEELLRVSAEIGFDSGGQRLTRDELHERR